MDKEQAIEKLNDIRCHVKETSAEEQALVMAINALKAQLSQEGTTSDTISRQALCEYALNQKDKSVTLNDIMRFPSAKPEYEPVTAEALAKTMSENTLYNFMAWHNVAFTLMNEMGFVICKRTM